MSVPSSEKSGIAVCPQCGAANRVDPTRLAEGPTCGQCRAALFPTHPFELTQERFERHVASSDYPVVVDFWAEWCGPCRMMAPAYAEAAGRVGPGVQLAKLDTDAAPEVAARHAIRSIPTLIAFRKGRELARQSGALPASQLVQWIGTHAAQE